MRKIQIAISSYYLSVYQIDMKFDRQLRPATETSWVVLYGGKNNSKMADGRHFGKTDISPYLSEPISTKFCTQQQILNWMNVTDQK